MEKQDLHFRGYLPGLDVLRGMAIALVVIYHGIAGRAGDSFSSGFAKWVVYLTTWGSSGVDLFYVLSGFLITGILLDTARSAEYYRRFYLHRAVRILPAYFLLLIALKISHTVSWAFVLAAVLYIANMASLVGARDGEYGSLWSLAVEEQFYLIWPLVVRRCSHKVLTGLIVAYCVAAVALRMVVIRFGLHFDLAYKLWSNADWLLSGALVAVTLRSGALDRENITRWMLGVGGLGLFSLPLVPYIDLGHHWSQFLVSAFFRTPFILIYVAMLLYVIRTNTGKQSAYQRGMLARILAFLGYISYGLYLVHSLIFTVYERLVGRSWLGRTSNLPSLFVGLLVCGSVSVGVAYLSRRYFEAYFLRIKGRAARVSQTVDTSSLVL